MTTFKGAALFVAGLLLATGAEAQPTLLGLAAQGTAGICFIALAGFTWSKGHDD